MALEPMDSTAGDGAARPMADAATAPAASECELPTTTEDPFLASAVKEYQEGRIDPTLWARATAQSGDDESLAVAAYLRARATALQLRNRDRRRERRARRNGARQDKIDLKAEPNPRPEIPSNGAGGVRLRGVQLKSKFAAAAAAAALASVVAAAWWTASPSQSDPVGPASASMAKPSVTEPAPQRPVVAAQPVGARGGDSIPELKATVQQLKDAANWNVLVLYASKWTRDEPDSAAAWNELSNGYAKLHQFNDALLAATRAAELSPEEASLWRNLGHLNMTLDRLPEAGSAFERALAADSDDADALCGAAWVARKLGKTKDADAMAARIKAADGSCHGPSDGESVTVVVSSVPAAKRASTVRR